MSQGPHTPLPLSREPREQQDWAHQPLPPGYVHNGSPPTVESATTKRVDERELVALLKKGDRAATRDLYRTYAPTLLRRLLRMLAGDMAQAEDCLQQVFVKALESIQGYRGDNQLHAWLNAIATRAVMDVFRANKRRVGLVQKLTQWKPVSGFDGNKVLPDKLFQRTELRGLLEEGLQSINEKKRMAVLLCDGEGYTIEEASAELNQPIGTVASRLYRGRQELRAWLTTAFRQREIPTEDWWHE